MKLHVLQDFLNVLRSWLGVVLAVQLIHGAWLWGFVDVWPSGPQIASIALAAMIWTLTIVEWVICLYRYWLGRK